MINESTEPYIYAMHGEVDFVAAFGVKLHTNLHITCFCVAA